MSALVRYNMPMSETVTRRKPGPAKRYDHVKRSVMLPADLADWAKSQPEGLSGMVRECIQKNYEARSSDVERLAQSPKGNGREKTG